jgi:hypothetical protein
MTIIGKSDLLPKFNAKRFDELVLYIAERTKYDKDFGSVKLAKVLFYSDLEAYRELGAPITGAEYQKWEYGPYPPKLEASRQMLKSAGRARPVKGGGYKADRLIPTRVRPADLQAVGISSEQTAIVDAWIARVERALANEISEASHDHPGYQMVDANDAIPYQAAFLAEHPPTDDEVSAATRIARERGWLVGDKWQRQ